MIIIYRSKPSASARELVETLANCRRALHFERRPPAVGDAVVAWGESYVAPNPEIRVLNGAPLINKFNAATKLKAAGVATVEVSRTRQANTPGGPAPREPFNIDTLRGLNQLTEAQARDLNRRLAGYFGAPLRQLPGVEWLGRLNNHIGGTDLLTPPNQPEYWSKKENLVEEYRVHCFLGKSIRAGKKIHNENDRIHHEWIRSLNGGWRISYDGFTSSKEMRKLAVDALKALSLDFGAVDIGKTADNKLIVLEVNRAPGVDGGTITAYAQAINNWYRGEEAR